MSKIELKPVRWTKVSEDFGAKMPKEVISEVRKALGRDMRQARQRLLANVSGAVLKIKTGRLAASIKTSIRTKGWEVAAKSGSKWYIGRFWDQGFTHHSGKEMPPRPWATSVMESMKGQLETDIKAAIKLGLKKAER